ncbi:TorD/DmsD family molecular chaperone [Corynebacterium guangdongense]|uniref:TorA maturation chaperone TorD n=1 Tax=Corynebacterium guangdongense TaxID=1783348 RepID=A0ABU1ZYC8_9CORY|nr:molecular chaperone TorD family protein [Corynebacterium guangdongense]MDR7329845.1 TorA maturation chaperone TorD [Corynebacterium guangdongense]WJZ18408.1 twin-argninine leader-binding protein DmsD [Corynebacterium guangdongense]
MSKESAQRVLTAALVISPLYLAAPSRGLRENLQNPTMLEAWPLADASSARGLAALNGGADTAEQLAHDHLYLYTGVSAPLAQPYESPYFSGDGLVMDERAAQVRAAYARLGFRAPDPRYPDDHIGLEIAFLAECARAINNGQDAAPLLREFLDDHLATFAPQVCAATRSHASTAIYRALPDLTEGLIASAYDLVS